MTLLLDFLYTNQVDKDTVDIECLKHGEMVMSKIMLLTRVHGITRSASAQRQPKPPYCD